MYTEELKRAWGEVPDRAIVMCRKPSWRGGAPWYGYRYGRKGRWIHYHESWDPGRMYWSWDLTNGNTEGLSDFVVIARDVSPHVCGAEAAKLCGLSAGPPRAIISFDRGSRILWRDVAPGMLVMVQGGTIVYKHADGSGQWVRVGFDAWREDATRWTWLGARYHCVQEVCGVFAVGVRDNMLRDTVGDLAARVELET